VSEPLPQRPRTVDVRVGSATNALEPVSIAERPLGAGRLQWLGLLAVAGAAVGADQLTKWIVIEALRVGEGHHILGPLTIRHVHNSGIAFGLFAGSAGPVVLLTALIVLALVAFFARAARRHPFLTVALGLVLGGSLSNLVDRVRHGHVTDFIDFDYWPAFNLADSFIVVGVGLLFLTFVAADRTSARVGSAPLSRL
jgi:signal peptidase II